MSNLYDNNGNRKYLTVQERTAFLDVARNMSQEVYTFCAVLAYSGARLSEVLALTHEQIDLNARLVIIECLKKRRPNVYRAVPIPQALVSGLEAVHGVSAARKDPVRSRERLWNCCRTTAWNRVKCCMDKANISGTQASPKGLRHSFAIAALQSGVPINFVRKWLGHARLSTTEVYTNAVGDEEQTIASRLWGTF
ncbi:MAG: site-specific integrase [Magnetococcales bacterium]|nr:site-specific integrase [Magnetococcales bacterium]MBF0116887.1 site-specific integrase [Magnetococcales bacterium]